jgi:hypothetical protein
MWHACQAVALRSAQYGLLTASYTTMHVSALPGEEEEGLQGVFKRLRRNGHQLEKGLPCPALPGGSSALSL